MTNIYIEKKVIDFEKYIHDMSKLTNLRFLFLMIILRISKIILSLFVFLFSF